VKSIEVKLIPEELKVNTKCKHHNQLRRSTTSQGRICSMQPSGRWVSLNKKAL
jgi:hypothetical protein